jgi:hypothetical protein
VDAVFARGLAKDPLARFDTCAAAIDSLSAALDDLPATVVAPQAITMTRRSRARWRIGMAATVVFVTFAGLLVANAVRDDTSSAPPADVDSTEPERAATPATTAVATESTDERDPSAAIAQNDRAFAALQAGRYQEAYDLAIGTLDDLRGVLPQEAYANYNVGAALVGLGRCAEAIRYLDRSEQLQGEREEIDDARAVATSCATDDGRPGKAKGKDKQRKHD